mmetsp:Transcript_38327/g.91573  ORF Transcript_38327/g.91573 Transcript_38327/m.91573 type:complete len:235 (-) Transcript_38327:20-724(-)
MRREPHLNCVGVSSALGSLHLSKSKPECFALWAGRLTWLARLEVVNRCGWGSVRSHLELLGRGRVRASRARRARKARASRQGQAGRGSQVALTLWRHGQRRHRRNRNRRNQPKIQVLQPASGSVAVHTPRRAGPGTNVAVGAEGAARAARAQRFCQGAAWAQYWADWCRREVARNLDFHRLKLVRTLLSLGDSAKLCLAVCELASLALLAPALGRVLEAQACGDQIRLIPQLEF